MSKKLHILPELKYPYNALEPYIDEETMRIHHDKHHASYVNNLNNLIEPYISLSEQTAEELLINLDQIPEDIRTAVKNNAGGHVNHTMFWEITTPKTNGEPSGLLAEEIKKCFGGLDDFKNQFNEAGLKRFGSGWVWLVQNNGVLEIMTTANQDNPITNGLKVVLGNDVWEHAYYLKYRNLRGDYLKNWWQVVNWEEVEKRFNKE